MIYITADLDLFREAAAPDQLPQSNPDAQVTKLVESNNSVSTEAKSDDRVSMSSQRASVSSQAAAGRHAKPSVPPMKVGMLKKDGHGLITSWKTRHFVLLNGKLTYYEKSTVVPPYGIGEKGSTNLANMQVSQIPSIPQFRMLLEHQVDKKVKSYVIEATTQKELQDWILAIDEHIEYASNGRGSTNVL